MKIIEFFKKNIFIVILFTFSIVVLLVNIRINLFRYNNFDYGKFDLGNMTQMLWNTLNGRFMYLTDYFGANLPRWAMSHVDPILLLFLPLFAIFQSPLTLVFSQLALVIFSSPIVYKIAEQELKSKLAALLLGLSYLFYPAIGYLTATTGFHGVTAVIPFFFLAFYIFEKMYKENNFSKKRLIAFWVMVVLTMSGKEQLGLYIVLLGFWILVFRNNAKLGLRGFKTIQGKLGLSLIVVGVLWFVTAFFVIIPSYAHYRVEGFNKFAESLDIDTSITRDVENANYFISRYAEFGDSYDQIILNMIFNPKKSVKVLFGGDKLDNFVKTLAPVGFLSFANPGLFVLSLPDFIINFSTTAGGIGTSEITNHRVSMIIPVIFISTIYAISMLSKMFEKKVKPKFVILGFSIIVLGLNIHTTFVYNNPVYLWITQAVQKRLTGSLVFAKEDLDTAKNDNIKVGDILRLSKLENKDRECANKIINQIPQSASVSGPDYLGAHLSMRETYAIFPALYNEADYVIVDVFSKKILNILDVDLSLVRDVVGDLIKNPDYNLEFGCGNLFVFRKVGPHGKSEILPLQEKFVYNEKMNLEIFQSLYIVDYSLPKEVQRGKEDAVSFAFIKRGNNSLDDYVLFMTLINDTTGEIYQVANLPSFGLTQLREWVQDRYYVEDSELILPGYLTPGTYKFFVGVSNVIRTRSIYLGNIEVK